MENWPYFLEFKLHTSCYCYICSHHSQDWLSITLDLRNQSIIHLGRSPLLPVYQASLYILVDLVLKV